MDDLSHKRIRENAQQTFAEWRNERLYHRTMLEHADDPVFFIRVKDMPDYDAFKKKLEDLEKAEDSFATPTAYEDAKQALKDGFYEKAHRSLKDMLDEQGDGLYRAFIEHYFQDKAEPGQGYVLPNSLIDGLYTEGPAVFPDVNLDGQTICLSVNPSQNFDSKDDFLRTTMKLDIRPFVKHIGQDVFDRFPMTDRDVNEVTAFHEVRHCNQDKEMHKGSNAEYNSDQNLLGKVSDEVLLAWKDERHLMIPVVASSDDVYHSTGALLVSGEEEMTPVYLEAAFYHNNNMGKFVFDNYDKPDVFVQKDIGQDGSFPEYDELAEILQADPEGFFKAINKGIASLEKDVLVAHEKYGLTHEVQHDVLAAQARIDYMRHFEAAYRRRFLGQGVPEATPSALVDLDRKAFYEEFDFRERHLAELIENLKIDKPKGLTMDFVHDIAFRNFDWEKAGYSEPLPKVLLFQKPDVYASVMKAFELDVLEEAADDNADMTEYVENMLRAEAVVDFMREGVYKLAQEEKMITVEPEPARFLASDLRDQYFDALRISEELIQKTKSDADMQAKDILQKVEEAVVLPTAKPMGQ